MASTVTQSMMSSTMNHTGNTSAPPHDDDAVKYYPVLLAIYSVVLVSGTISLSLMMNIMKSSATSTTSIAVLNLIFAHFIFLVTVPFRIYFYVTQKWFLGVSWCKVVSGMIHIHMYMSFVFYVIILIMRLMTFYHRAEQLASFQRIHALLVSAVVWLVVLITVPFVIHYTYGNNNAAAHNNMCFRFGTSIGAVARVINYITSILIIVVATVLTALQANILRVLYRKHQGCTSQQDFGAQLKSLCFALNMVVCFIPYHVFRLFYLVNITNLEDINEVFLSLTTFCCLDMLTFLGRRSCNMCCLRRAVCV